MHSQPVSKAAPADQSAIQGNGRIDAAVEEEYRSLADQWHRETDFHSSISVKINHPAYQKIIALGDDALPLILGDLANCPSFLYLALQTLTKQNPVPQGANPKACAEAWLAWGKERGLIQ
jgi:hypothetical protein